MNSPSSDMKPSGRPRKFRDPSRVVTITLPESTLEKLAAIHPDRAHAIVLATEIASEIGAGSGSGVRVVDVAPNTGMLTMPFCKDVAEVDGLDLVRIWPSRHIVVIERGTSLPALELSIIDRLDSLAPDGSRDASVLKWLLDQLRAIRRGRRARTAEVILVETD